MRICFVCLADRQERTRPEMTLLQRYFLAQTRRPLILSLAALTGLAILTQSLQTLDLIVENQQSGLAFLKITFLALPQLISIILPLSVFMATLYALNHLNEESELVVAKASGYSPWQITRPILRLAIYAMLAHIFINLVLQPFSFRQMRAEVFKIRTDIASQMIKEGEFITPLNGVTVYARRVEPHGKLTDVIIYDERDQEMENGAAITQTARSGDIQRNGSNITLRLRNGAIQKLLPDGTLNIVEFEDYIVDFTELPHSDRVMRLKPTDRYIHELFNPDAASLSDKNQKEGLLAEAHARLSTPFYNPALALLALCFMVRGEHRRMGYGRSIAICAGLGFVIRLTGFGITSAAEAHSVLNVFQYALPITTIMICMAYIFKPRKMDRSNGS